MFNGILHVDLLPQWRKLNATNLFDTYIQYERLCTFFSPNAWTIIKTFTRSNWLTKNCSLRWIMAFQNCLPLLNNWHWRWVYDNVQLFCWWLLLFRRLCAKWTTPHWIKSLFIAEIVGLFNVVSTSHVVGKWRKYRRFATVIDVLFFCKMIYSTSACVHRALSILPFAMMWCAFSVINSMSQGHQ